MRVIFFILFLLVAICLYSFLHYFLYQRIASGFDLSVRARHVLLLLFVVAALSFVIGELLGRFSFIFPVTYFGSVWFGMVAIAFTAMGLEWIISRFWRYRSRMGISFALAVSLMVALISLFRGGSRPLVREIVIPLKNLPAEKTGFSIVQVSDIHLGNMVSRQRLSWIIERTNNLQPDLIVVTGDLIDRDIGHEEGYCQLLKSLRARYGVFGVTGNHEYFAGLARFRHLSEEMGMTVLQNEMRVVAGFLQVVGLNDDQAHEFSLPAPNLDQAMSNVDSSKPTLLLYHRPTRFALAVAKGVGLQLSGHTHAGQIPPADLMVRLLFRYPFGLFRLRDAFIYTSCGTGTWGPPMRFLSRSEIVHIVLTQPMQKSTEQAY